MEQGRGDPGLDWSPPSAPAGPYIDGTWLRPVPPAPPETWGWRAWGWPFFLFLLSSIQYCHLKGLAVSFPSPSAGNPATVEGQSERGRLRPKNSL